MKTWNMMNSFTINQLDKEQEKRLYRADKKDDGHYLESRENRISREYKPVYRELRDTTQKDTGYYHPKERKGYHV